RVRASEPVGRPPPPDSFAPLALRAESDLSPHAGRGNGACGTVAHHGCVSGVSGATGGCSGQRARGLASSVSLRPRASRSAPAQAMMAPLSVHSDPGGATSRTPAPAALLLMAPRTSPSAPPPPPLTPP